jgi:hypothetical protein
MKYHIINKLNINWIIRLKNNINSISSQKNDNFKLISEHKLSIDNSDIHQTLNELISKFFWEL